MWGKSPSVNLGPQGNPQPAPSSTTWRDIWCPCTQPFAQALPVSLVAAMCSNRRLRLSQHPKHVRHLGRFDNHGNSSPRQVYHGLPVWACYSFERVEWGQWSCFCLRACVRGRMPVCRSLTMLSRYAGGALRRMDDS